MPSGIARQAVWIWTEDRTETDDLFAQKLDSTGARCWDTTGVWVGATDTVDGYPFSATADGRGGVITAWPLFRTSGNSDEYAQHFDSSGLLCWSDTGLSVCRGTANQNRTPAVVPDGDGGAIIVWLEWRWGVGSAICAQRVADGAAVTEAADAEVRATNSGPTVVRGELMMDDRGRSTDDRAELMDALGRKVSILRAGPNDVGYLSPGVYFVRKEAQATCREQQAVRKVVITR